MQSSPSTRTQQLHLRRGIAVLRYTSGSNASVPPVLQFDLNASVSVLTEPGQNRAELTRIGQCLVMRIDANTAIAVRSVPLRGGSSADAGLTVEYLTQISSGFERSSSQPVHGREQASSDMTFIGRELNVLGHVSRLGDRRAGAGEWLAGPERPLPIEGLSIQFSQPDRDLRLFYVASDSARSDDLPPMIEGGFSGTRGQARSVRQLLLELRGEQSENYELKVAAMFLGGYPKTFAGRKLHIKAPTGKEPLVGLKIEITRINKVDSAAVHASGSIANHKSDILIFR